MENRIPFLGLYVDALTMEETLKKIEKAISKRQMIHHVVINAAKVVKAGTDQALKESIANCDIINADGQSIIWASRFLRKPLPERVTGIDLMIKLIEVAAANKYKIFLLGAKEEVLKEVVKIYAEKFGDNLIAGCHHGYFPEGEEKEIANKIGSSRADMLFVALSSPRKEIFLSKYKNVIDVPFVMGVGGSFDVIAGRTKRAPVWMQKTGLEWFYRLVQEPRRMWRRYLVGNLMFLFLVFKEKIMKNKR